MDVVAVDGGGGGGGDHDYEGPSWPGQLKFARISGTTLTRRQAKRGEPVFPFDESSSLVTHVDRPPGRA